MPEKIIPEVEIWNTRKDAVKLTFRARDVVTKNNDSTKLPKSEINL